MKLITLHWKASDSYSYRIRVAESSMTACKSLRALIFRELRLIEASESCSEELWSVVVSLTEPKHEEKSDCSSVTTAYNRPAALDTAVTRSRSTELCSNKRFDKATSWRLLASEIRNRSKRPQLLLYCFSVASSCTSVKGVICTLSGSKVFRARSVGRLTVFLKLPVRHMRRYWIRRYRTHCWTR